MSSSLEAIFVYGYVRARPSRDGARAQPTGKKTKRIARKDYWRRLLSPFATAKKKKKSRKRAETFRQTPTRDDENSPTRSAFRALKVISSIFESIARIARLQKRAQREKKTARVRICASLSLSTAGLLFDFSFHFEKKKKRKKRGKKERRGRNAIGRLALENKTQERERERERD